LARRIAERLGHVPGVAAVVLGGSRGRGWAHPDSDFDLGLYYHPANPIDLKALQGLAVELDDGYRDRTVTPPGEWGRWVNGGAWLTIEGKHVDWLYRDIEQVTGVIADCREGRISADYYLGHPHAFHSYIYLGEVATCRPLYDPGNVVAAMKALATPYPMALKDAIVGRYLYDARFMLEVSRSPARRGDVFASTGFFFRVVAALVQVLFALNGEYFLNEKGAIERIEQFELRPQRFPGSVRKVLGRPGSTPGQLEVNVAALDRAVTSVEALARRERRR
jgi:hypothetical protein